MSNVVCIDTAKPHLAGAALCNVCRYEWQAVAPVGITELECPKCGAVHGFFKVALAREAPSWVCLNCGRDVFRLYQDGAFMCVMCGHASNIEEAMANLNGTAAKSTEQTCGRAVINGVVVDMQCSRDPKTGTLRPSSKKEV